MEITENAKKVFLFVRLDEKNKRNKKWDEFFWRAPPIFLKGIARLDGLSQKMKEMGLLSLQKVYL